MNAPFQIELFGGLRVTLPEETITRFRTRKTASLLAYLACYSQRDHPREELIELLWPDTDMEAGRSSLRTALASLRRQLEPPGTPEGAFLIADRTNVRLNSETVTTDARRFEELVRRARRQETLAEQVETLRQAIALYRGPLLPGFYEDWALREQERFRTQSVETLRTLSMALVELGRPEQAIEYAQRIVAEEPLLEEAHIDLMRLQAAAGQYDAAFRHYDEMERRLRQEIGAPPSPETQAFRQELKLQRASSHVARTPFAVGGTRPLRLEDIPASEISSSPVSIPALPPRRTDAVVGLADFPALASAAPTPVKLPLLLTRFFGRSAELESLTALLAAPADHAGSGEPPFSFRDSFGSRLLTLTGPGGSGKTRLAVEAAHRVADSFPGGVWFVPLAEIADANLLPGTVLSTLRPQQTASSDPLNQLMELLGDCPALLVLDNFEQLKEDGAPVVLELLHRIPALVCLVTSRQRLDLGGEQEFPVPPLPMPTLAGTPEHMLQYPAVQLFVDRARAARPDFQITPENAVAIVSLCSQLEGIPLALELAAAWAQVLTPAQMLARSAQRFDLLTSRRKDLAPRHRALRATIEWSYRLLSPELQQFFLRLAIFRGGWTLEAAEIVCQEPVALEYLLQLRERSLIVTQEADGEMRFRLLETLRQYALEQLPPEDREALSRRHLEFYLQFALEAEKQLHGPEQTLWLERLNREMDNFRSALEQTSPQALQLAANLYFFWYVRGPFSEGYRHLMDLLAKTQEQPGIETAVRIRAMQGAGELAHALGKYAESRALFEESLPLCREAGKGKQLAHATCYLGIVAEAVGDRQKARERFEESILYWRREGDRGGEAHSLKCLGSNHAMQGDLERARVLFEEGLAIYRELGNPRGINMMLGEMALLLITQGDYADAQKIGEESLLLSRELKDLGHTRCVLLLLGQIALKQQDYAVARSLHEQALALARELGDRNGASAGLYHLGCVAHEEGNEALAEEFLRAGLREFHAIGARQGVAGCLEALADLPAQASRADLLRTYARDFRENPQAVLPPELLS